MPRNSSEGPQEKTQPLCYCGKTVTICTFNPECPYKLEQEQIAKANSPERKASKDLN